ncbi:DNA-binding transcriptional regulator CsiR [uncultured Pseudomonas sp.]|uniref:DNA-binding transcriptional regulator CsiR n=1 Tax=uncultured Pseudomonas sp. TaxID=114707 RepID=UPI002615AAEF|nr:DNA-binding transcriptional regulator CsiR [uncultured Pseudomonas sp.]
MQTPGSRENLAIRAYQLLKRDIIRGVFAPSEKLLMSTLKTRYDLGVGPLREALSQLVAERLVVAISQRGFRVAPMSLAELADIYDARAHLEALILGLAIARGDDAWEAQILAHAHSLAKVVAIKDTDEMLSLWDARHQAFHSALAAGCGSPHLLQVRRALFDQAERYRHLWLQQTVFSAAALQAKREEHTALVEATLQRDSERACAMIREHLLGPVNIISELLKT